MHVKQHLADIQTAVDDALKLALKQGASAAEASMSKVQGIAVASRMKELETVEFTNDGGLGIAVYVGNRKGSASTSDLSPSALRMTVEKAVEIAKYTNEDDCAGLADAHMMVKDIPDLDLYHPIELDTDKGIQLAIEAETAGLDVDDRISNSDGGSYNANVGVKVYGNTHGINAGYPSSRYSLSCVLIAQDADDMQRDYAYTVSRLANELNAPEQVGKEAAKSTLSRLNAQKLSTMKVPVLFDKEIASGLFGHLISAISGGSLYRQSSYLLDHLGKQVLPQWLSIEEKPHLKRALASSPFDSQGVETKDMTIIENGILNHYILSSYSAKKLGMQTNGHAGGIHNWIIGSSGETDKQMLEKLGTGLLVTELMGQGVNIVNGDYSRGAAGFWVENGVIQYPVHEITVAGNLKDMLLNIVAVGAQREVRGSVQTGSILIDELQVAGA